jgi:DNA polymerase III epsilon subunit-like protein
VDLETGGFDARFHDVLELAAVRTNHDAMAIRGHLKALVLPRDLAKPRIKAEAAAVNDFDAERWAADAHPIREVLTAFARLAKGARYAGHHVSFDIRFLFVASARCSVPILTAPGDPVDTEAIARPMKRRKEVKSVSLDALTDHFGIPSEGAHTAPVDVRRTIQLFRILRDQAVRRQRAVAAVRTATVDTKGRTNAH